jgi:hypothetical protein
MHALNNALGRPAIDVNRFNAACDAFDARYGLQGSRHYFLLADARSPPQPPSDGATTTTSASVLSRPPKNESDAETTDERCAADGDDQPHVTKEGEEEDEEEEEEGDDEEEEEGVIDVLSYILREQFRYRTRYIPMGGTVRRGREELEQCEAFLSFSEGHVWANRRVGNTW